MAVSNLNEQAITADFEDHIYPTGKEEQIMNEPWSEAEWYAYVQYVLKEGPGEYVDAYEIEEVA